MMIVTPGFHASQHTSNDGSHGAPMRQAIQVAASSETNP
jgi:hypothetical protein